MHHTALLAQEWQTLQGNHEAHEKTAQWIKLGSLAFALGGIALQLPLQAIACIVLLCWGQEAMLKTFQSRLGDRLLAIESMLRQPSPGQAAMQLHSEWQASRPGQSGLISAYATNALRPTVAFPYLPLLLLGLLAVLLD